MATRKTSIAGFTGTYRVRQGKALKWPRWLFAPRLGIARGEAGYVVDLDQPYEKLLCANQAQVLEPAPGERPVPITLKPVLIWMRDNGYAQKEDLSPVKVKQALSEREKLAREQSDLPGLDQPPGHARARKSKVKEKPDAVEG